MTTGSGKEDEVMADINTTPLIDVMLVLLIMFIITIPVQMHSVKMNMPVASNAPPPDRPPVVVKIDLDDAGNVTWNGESVTGHAALEARMAQMAALPDQPEVHLKPTKATEYVHVAAVMASAQRIGLNKIGIVGNERFIQ
ncbi:MAG TPA: biopolymer transporter ExbD [Rhodocyclaceae bacterium]|nr:biopolymer transporter ExbD [Rhodocyclaceae bacterium]